MTQATQTLEIGRWLAQDTHTVAEAVRSGLRPTYDGTMTPPAHPPTPAECQRYYDGTSPVARDTIRQAYLGQGQP
jgi:hypothetical protein